MQTVVWDEGKHKLVYEAWWRARGISDPPGIPKVMLVVEDSEGKPMAAGGLVQTDSDYAIVDGYARDPALSPEKAQEALFRVSLGLTQVAKHLKIKRAILMSVVPNVLEHAKIVGATPMDQSKMMHIWATDVEKVLNGI